MTGKKELNILGLIRECNNKVNFRFSFNLYSLSTRDCRHSENHCIFPNNNNILHCRSSTTNKCFELVIFHLPHFIFKYCTIRYSASYLSIKFLDYTSFGFQQLRLTRYGGQKFQTKCALENATDIRIRQLLEINSQQLHFNSLILLRLAGGQWPV